MTTFTYLLIILCILIIPFLIGCLQNYQSTSGLSSLRDRLMRAVLRQSGRQNDAELLP